jgi:hypothetical protein
MAQSTQEKPLSYLKDTHALEQMSLQMTQAAAKVTKDPQCVSCSSITMRRHGSTSG